MTYPISHVRVLPKCRTCTEPYCEFGDGYNGECPDCADKTYAGEDTDAPDHPTDAGQP